MVSNALNGVIATNRFGMGARSGEIAEADADPRNWLLSQLAVAPGRKTRTQTVEAVSQIDAFQNTKRAKDEDQLKTLRQQIRDAYRGQSALRARLAIESRTSFLERLTHFWSNHFAVSTDKNIIRGLAGPFEQEAIRPNILSNFYDLLRSSTQHPAMLLYLDNAQSIGPQSRFGRSGKRGRNEKQAREVLELQTMGVRSGYTQEDVTNFAKVLTGWTVPIGRVGQRLGLKGRPFAFVERMHEPGNHEVMGKRYEDEGVNQGLAVLKDLSVHEKTAHHIALKLCRHFVADEPSVSLVDRLKNVFLDTGGDLKSVYKAMIESDLAWGPERKKFKAPNEWMISAFRGLGVLVRDKHLANSTYALGQPTYQPGSPAGFSDQASAWDGPAQLGARIDWAQVFAGRLSANRNVAHLARQMLGDSVSKSTADAIRRAESNAQGLTLLLVSPEFMRR
ncbi:MAG: DUF1800 domain-containing protein [Pseudomonadota bacterium]